MTILLLRARVSQTNLEETVATIAARPLAEQVAPIRQLNDPASRIEVIKISDNRKIPTATSRFADTTSKDFRLTKELYRSSLSMLY